MTTKELIEGYTPFFSASAREALIRTAQALPTIQTFTDEMRLALFEHAIECGIKDSKRTEKESAFLSDVRTLADLRGWHKLRGLVSPVPAGCVCGDASDLSLGLGWAE